MIRKSKAEDLGQIFEVINDAAVAYQGVIPEDRWHEPYMTMEELKRQIREGVEFLCYVENQTVIGVMGIQDRGDVDLIRHAYVRTASRKKGIGTRLLRELVETSDKPILIGTWKAATWAIDFYRKNGFALVSEEQKNRLLKKYWTIPERQVETSVVLMDKKFAARCSSD